MPIRSALARHPLALVGGVITTVTAVVFIALAIAEAIGLFENTYAGLVIFVVLPAIFLLGLLLIPPGCGCSSGGCDGTRARASIGPRWTFAARWSVGRHCSSSR